MTFDTFIGLLARKPKAKVLVLSTDDREELLDELEYMNRNMSDFVLDRSKRVFVGGVLVKDEVNS